MLKIQFENAKVYDGGYGLEVNGKKLEDVISTALGTKVGNNYGHNSGLPNFESNCCNVIVIIDPQPSIVTIEDDEGTWDSVEGMEEDVHEQYNQKVKTPKG